MTLLLLGCVQGAFPWWDQDNPHDDFDGDGFTEMDGDCDDGSAAVHPGAEERCNGLDDDCDGNIDGADALEIARWFLDVDGDGFGSPVHVDSCEQVVGAVADSTDCDDGDAGVHPNAEESCNSLDDDCDGAVDEGLDLSGYLDQDGDGYGVGELLLSCALPLAEQDGDCDDGDESVQPGAAETWYDGVDQDCLGDDDWDADADGQVPESFGGGDCDDTDPDSHRGAEEICDDGVDQDCDGTSIGCRSEGAEQLGTANRLLGPSGGLAGGPVAIIGDRDGDGTGDLLIAAPRAAGYSCFTAETDPLHAGKVWFVSGAEATTQVLGDPTWSGGVHLGTAMLAADFTGDGLDEVVLLGHGPSLWIDDQGAVTVVEESLSLPVCSDGALRSLDADSDGDLDLFVTQGRYQQSGAAWLLEDPLTGFEDQLASISGPGFGVGGTAVDLDGTGLADVVGGTIQPNAAVRVFSDPVGELGTDDADWVLVHASSTTRLGYVVVPAGDVDGDGLEDVAVTDSDSTGTLYLLGADSLGQPGEDTIWSRSRTSVLGQGGAAYADFGDLDGDGVQDLALASPTGAGGDGVVAVFYGPISSGGYASTDSDLDIQGPSGAAIDRPAIGHVDGDGAGDLLVGSPSFQSESGAAWLWYGSGL